MEPPQEHHMLEYVGIINQTVAWHMLDNVLDILDI